MLTELCSSDWVVQLLSDGGTALQKLAEEQMLCLGPEITCWTAPVISVNKQYFNKPGLDLSVIIL